MHEQMRKARAIGVFFTMAIAMNLAACGDATAPVANGDSGRFDAKSGDVLSFASRRVLRAESADSRDLIVIGETHVLLNGQAVKLTPDLAALVLAELALQENLDATETRMRATWNKMGLESVNQRVARKFAEAKAMKKAAKEIAVELGTYEAHSFDYASNVMNASSPSCAERAETLIDRTASYRFMLGVQQEALMANLSCIFTAPSTISITPGQNGPQFSMNDCSQESFNAGLATTIVNFQRFGLEELGQAYKDYGCA